MTTLLRENQNRIDRVIDRIAYCAIDLEKASADPNIPKEIRPALVALARQLDQMGIAVALQLHDIGVERSPHPEHGTTSL